MATGSEKVAEAVSAPAGRRESPGAGVSRHLGRAARGATPISAGPAAALWALVGGAGAVVVEEGRRAWDRIELRALRARLRAEEVARRDVSAAESLAEVGAPARARDPSVAGALRPGLADEVAPRSVGGRAPSVPVLEVLLLGPIEVRGAPGPFDRAKVLESLAYLVCHDAGVDKQVWAAALWPDQACTQGSLNTAIWQLRRALGVSEAGTRYLLPMRGGKLRLAPEVSSDLRCLEVASGGTASSRSGAPGDRSGSRWSRRADCEKAFAGLTYSSDRLGASGALRASDDPGDEAARAATVLGLVRGRPFAGLGDPEWLFVEGIAARVESLILGAAVTLAGWCLEMGDFDQAEWALRQGLLANPYDEECYRLLARSARAAGNLGALFAVTKEWRRVVGEIEASGLDRSGLRP